ncbi:MAG: Sensor protein [Ramlibacter sp.]|nr:Sensor protein [Ramlibacter sp.]
MNAAVSAARRGLDALRRSMTAQISLAITLVSVLIILFFGMMIDRFLARELREESELLLLSNLAFIRDDLAAAGNDPALAPRLVDRATRRTRRLHAEIVDEQRGSVIARSANYAAPAPAPAPPALATELLPAEATVAQVEGLRGRLGAVTSIWEAPDGIRYRVLRGRIPLPAQGAQPPRSLLVALAIETTPTRELRRRNRQNLETALAVAAVLASLFGVWIARRILVNVRGLGAAASRIGALALHERLPLDDTPTELVESTLAFNHMLDRLQNAFDRLSAFSSDLAHDLRTPIGNLLGEAQVALSRPRSAEEYRAVLESAVEEYERMSRMIANMLFLARADNQAAVAARWTDVRSALERVAGYFELLAEERGVVLELDCPAPSGAAPRVWADESMLVRALSNLVSNALQYAQRGTAIRLAAAEGAGGDCRIEVSNEGPPIAAEHQPRIFERFYRVDASRQGSASGSGLGLAIVRSIMELHRGTVSVASAPGRRTVFRLHFPAEGAAGGSPPDIAER